MGNWATFLLFICVIFAVVFLVLGLILGANNSEIFWYFLTGGIGGFILFASIGTLLGLQVSNSNSIGRVIQLLSEKIKQDVRQIECKTCFKKYDSTLRTCPHCGAKT
ncbi:MAG: hypothetical protein JXD23_08090 [Spirochaetales bacterium]|nr:hypothetical protein [Spirochaetales bacterium]